MDMRAAVRSVFMNYAQFQGRARRSEYWYFTLFNVLANICFMVLGSLMETFDLEDMAALLSVIYSLGIFVPSLAVLCRRLHDTGRGGEWMLLMLLPVAGGLILLIWCAAEGTPGPNRFGADPKGRGTSPAYPHAMQNDRANLQSYLSVRCLNGPLTGQSYRISPNGLMFGRSVECAVRLPDQTPGISSRHCMIRFQQGAPVLIDLGSTYGTYLADGKKLPPQYPEPVAAGTRFYLGGRNVLFELYAL